MEFLHLIFGLLFILNVRCNVICVDKPETGLCWWYNCTDPFGAASNTHPIGSTVLVENFYNYLNVTVRITDTLPPESRNIINVCQGAAQELQMINPALNEAVSCSATNPNTTDTKKCKRNESQEISMTTETVDYGHELVNSTTTPSTTTSDNELISSDNCSHCIEAKYLNHYYAKGCTPIYDSNGCENCPKKFDCEQKINITLGYNECLYNGSKYKIGESIPVPNPCQICQCGYEFDEKYHYGYNAPFTTIHCTTVECPEDFAVHSFPVAGVEKDFENNKNCYKTYEFGKCCSVGKKCLDAKQSVNTSFCIYDNKTYQLGEKIYPKEDNCKVCICDHNWNPNDTISNSGCHDVQCSLDINFQFEEGCVPIYHENTCCPIEFYCPEREKTSTKETDKCSQPSDTGPCLGIFKRFYYDSRDKRCHSFVFGGCGGNENNFKELEECEESCVKPNINKTVDNEEIREEVNETNIENYCSLNGNKYTIGQKLDIGMKCVECECRIPPDLTCIHRSCPTPPIDKCKVIYTHSSCCPIVDCNYTKINDNSFDPLSCPTPLCDKGCSLETYPDRCPVCICEPNLEDQEVPDYDITDI